MCAALKSVSQRFSRSNGCRYETIASIAAAKLTQTFRVLVQYCLPTLDLHRSTVENVPELSSGQRLMSGGFIRADLVTDRCQLKPACRFEFRNRPLLFEAQLSRTGARGERAREHRPLTCALSPGSGNVEGELSDSFVTRAFFRQVYVIPHCALVSGTLLPHWQ
jgi:hypothetical protein